MMGVPTFYTRLLADGEFSATDCATVRVFISGSAPLPAETFKAIGIAHRTSHFGALRHVGGCMIASNPLEGERVAGTVGYPLPGVEIRVTAEGRALPPGEPASSRFAAATSSKVIGECPTRPPRSFARRVGSSTGDVGVIAPDGRLTLSGRARDLIIVGGYNVYPKEIEEILDAVDGVAEAAVIGVPHADMGEGRRRRPHAVARIGRSAPVADADLSAAVATMARFKQPRKFFWLDALPRNAMGKVQKQALRASFKDAFNT